MNTRKPSDISKPASTFDNAPSSITIAASGTVTPEQNLQLKWEVKNQSDRDIFVFDRLWKFIKDGKEMVADEDQVYRFVQGDTLMLAMCAAPIPTSVLVTFRNVPYATRVMSGDILTREFELPAPIREYNYYFPHSDKSQYKPATVSRGVLVLACLKAESMAKTIPAPFDDEALFVNVPGVWNKYRFLKSKDFPLNLELQRREDEFERRIENPVISEN